MKDLYNHPWTTNWIDQIIFFIKSHPLLWFCLVIVLLLFYILNSLTNILPKLDILKAQLLLPIVSWYKHKKLTKSAIKSDIRGHVNLEISKMKDYLPAGWAEEMDVTWVENENLEHLKQDNKIVVRIRPVECQDRNFVNATYHYLKSSFFPKTQQMIPKAHLEASVLHICGKIVKNRGNEAVEIFEDHVMEPIVRRHGQLTNHLDAYKKLDARGLFTGTFLRELHLMAIGARFTPQRNSMPRETTSVLKHVEAFIKSYDASHTKGEKMISADWYHNGEISKYAILLVANPERTKHGIEPYIRRAQNSFISGTERIYVFGSNKESSFANSVMSGIEGAIQGVRLVEKFKTPFDYRGDKYGIGAVFELRS